eukprot:TRINITY_DN2300_c0_g1_i1.p1 TRINITY_DN2300_c0_g1~~TRINITY_DN2300_c0_g1_i1.p1  ORF type:complete len:77 (+),score=11.65 TRINITY_DN2300_c0_g1_i1:149-379(+)
MSVLEQLYYRDSIKERVETLLEEHEQEELITESMERLGVTQEQFVEMMTSIVERKVYNLSKKCEIQEAKLEKLLES